ncbi:hypothetical protein LTR84_007314 [Exophiala bonariae]|uniref:Carboxylesterase type B domain-containing protein n=1 Tax=Exophiala bonariae TaxID=1690606 RepID=A0AAV9MZC7_9EURO|nr:hypothetical protein LTR84_007314 [Exophiala bonariae]
MAFKIPNWLTVHKSKLPKTYAYHFDQLSTIPNIMNGTAYHAHELLYVFLNGEPKFDEKQKQLAQRMCEAWIKFAYGEDPWQPFDQGNKWMGFGPDNCMALKSEAEDKTVRCYSRFKKIVESGIWPRFVSAIDNLVNRRDEMGQ